MERKELEFKGTKYKSKGEVRIAKFLDELEFDFEYEFPISVLDEDKKHRVWYPDFYLKEFQIVIEFFGMEGDSNYDKGTENKKRTYKNCGIEMIELKAEDLRKNWIEELSFKLRESLRKKNKKIIKKTEGI